MNISVNTFKKGFTLIEIMVVILIMGVIAAGAFGGLRYLQRVKESTTYQKLASLDTSLEQYNVTIGKYPTELRELVDGPSEPQFKKKWGSPIASEQDLVDAWQKEFSYTLNPKGAQPPYELFSTGPKGVSQLFSPRSQEV